MVFDNQLKSSGELLLWLWMGKDYLYCNLKFQVESHISLKIQFIAVSMNTPIL